MTTKHQKQLKKQIFRRTVMASLISLAAGTTAHASTVTDTIDYQYYRDFAENKGKFAVNASNIEVFNKAGESRGQLFPDGTPMIDLAGVSTNGVAHLIDPQYVGSVKHNTGYTSVHFGIQRSRAHAEQNFDYLLVDRNNKADTSTNVNVNRKNDYHIPRLHKLVTEAAPTPISNLSGSDLLKLTDRSLYSHIVRTGAGTQVVRPAEGADRGVAGPYQYVLGGNIMDTATIQLDNHILWIGENDTQKAVLESRYGPLPTVAMGGDSGSPLFAYDVQKKQWVAIAVHQAGDRSRRNWTVLHHPDFINEKITEDRITLHNPTANAQLNWVGNGNTSTITHQQNNTQTNVDLHDAALADPSVTTSHPDLNHGKTVHFTGENGTLHLAGDINQGAGALYFDNDFTVSGSQNNTTWLGAGVSVAEGKTVNWRVHNPDGDRLSKIGKGSLNVSGVGVNQGKISVGDGRVLLNQQADAQNQKQAFSEVNINSGRGTVVLGDANQVNPDNIVFGFRGGRLDVNGNDVNFGRLRSVDDGAKIVNHHTSRTANVVFAPALEGLESITADNVRLETNRNREYQPMGVYANRHRDGHIDYYAIKTGAVVSATLPREKGVDNASWAFLSADLEEAKRLYAAQENQRRRNAAIHFYEGQLGEMDGSSHHNGQMNFAYRPAKSEGQLVLSGNVNLNGNLSVDNGTLLLSGAPTPHAYDHVDKKDVVYEDDWQNRQFKAQQINVSGDGKLLTSRNTGSLNGNIHASNNATVQLGFINGETPVCYRSEHTGLSVCDTNAISDKALAQSPQLQYTGDITLNDAAKLILNTQHTGSLNTAPQSTVQLASQGHWILPASHTISNLEGASGSQITLNPQFQQNNPTGNVFQTLTLSGLLDGNVQFNLLSNLANNQADKLVVNGYAAGAHTLNVKNTGSEANIDKLTLVELKHAAQNPEDVSFQLLGGHVDAGAYRYTLQNDAAKAYYLSNPKRAAELAKLREEQAQKAAEAAAQAQKALSDAEAARQAAETARQKAEEALQQALANSNANAQDVANAQQAAEAARQLAEQANREKEALAANLETARQQLANAQAEHTATQRLKEQAEALANNLQADKTRLENEFAQANRDKQAAETAQNTAQTQLQAALNAQREAENAQAQAIAAQQAAQAAQQTAENQAAQAQRDLAEAQRLQAAAEKALQDAQADGGKALSEAQAALKAAQDKVREQEQTLAAAQAAQSAAEQQRDAAQLAQQNAQNQLNQAQQDLNAAQAETERAQAQATAAQNAQQAAEQQLNQAQNQLSQAQTDKERAEQQARDAETARLRAEAVQKELEQAQAAQNAALQNAQQAAELAQQAQQRAEAEAVRQAELARQAETAKTAAEQAQKLAEDARNQAQTDLTVAQNAKTAAENAQQLAETARTNAERELQAALNAKNDAESAKNQAQTELANALREKEQAEEALKVAQANNSQDVVALQNQLAQANQSVKDKEQALTQAQAAQTAAEQAQKSAENQRDAALQSAQQAEAARTSAEQTLAQIQAALNQAQADKQAADAEAARQAELARQAETAKTAAEQAQKLAEDARNQAQTDLTAAQNAKTAAENAQQLAETARNNAERELQAALNAKNDAESAKNQAQTELANALREKEQAEEALKVAQANNSQDVVALQNQLAQANQSVKDKEQALTQAQAAQTAAEQAQKSAENQRDAALQSAQQAEAARTSAEQTLAQIQAALNQAQAETARQTELARQAETARQAAELQAQNAQQAQALAEQAQAQAQAAKIAAEQAQAETEAANQRLQAAANADAQTIAQAQADLQKAQQTAEEKTQALAAAENQLNNTQAQLAQAQQQAALVEQQRAQEQRLREQAQAAQIAAEQAQQAAQTAQAQAIAAQNQSEAARQAAEAQLAEAQKVAQEKAAEAEQLRTQHAELAQQLAASLAQAQNQAAELAKAQADANLAAATAKEEEAKRVAAEAEAQRLAQEAAAKQAAAAAALAQQQKQSEVISRYANAALSEMALQSHHLRGVAQRIDERVRDLNGNNAGAWVQVQAEKSRHESDFYRGFEQDSQLTQLGVDKTVDTANGQVSMGAALSHLRHSADYDDGFSGKGQSTVGSIYGKWQPENGVGVHGDVAYGRADSELTYQNRSTDIKRDVASVGLGLVKDWQASGLDIQAHAGARYHHLGATDYAIEAEDGRPVQVEQDGTGIVSYQVGVNVGKTLQTESGVQIRPSIGVAYRDSNSDAVMKINGQSLTQKFAAEWESQAGIGFSKNNWEVKLKANYAKNSESGYRKSAFIGLTRQW